ncbi:MAG: hypothetical protein RL563_308 [Pseudomonadota bacterium]
MATSEAATLMQSLRHCRIQHRRFTAEIIHLINRQICGECFAFAENTTHNLLMNSGNYTYIWQAADWPKWRYDLANLVPALTDVSRAKGMLMGRLADVGMAF